MGILVGLRTREGTLRRARRTAMIMQEVIGGAEAGEMPTAFPSEERLTINMQERNFDEMVNEIWDDEE